MSALAWTYSNGHVALSRELARVNPELTLPFFSGEAGVGRRVGRGTCCESVKCEVVKTLDSEWWVGVSDDADVWVSCVRVSGCVWL